MSEIFSCFVTQSTGLRVKKDQAIVAIKADVVAKGIFYIYIYLFIYLLYGKLRERARWTEFRAVINYPRGQDGAILPARDCPFCSRKNISPKF